MLNNPFAQLEGVIVETYYISDADDATDTFGGMLEAGTTTYRIYIDLAAGSRLLEVYGDNNHPLVFSSTEHFFNHESDGETFAFELNRGRWGDGTAPLDTWLTIGQLSRPFDMGAYYGVRKELDLDGSVVGGENNDGGSEELPGGLLNNDVADLGIALTEADGLSFVDFVPVNWSDIDFVSELTGEDSTIFGSEDVNEFSSNTARLFNDGVVMPFEENEIIIAQLTTKGELTFQINLVVAYEENGQTQIVRYVGNETGLQPGEEFNPLLNFPWTCGCKDPNFLEASPSFACEDNSQCVTPVVYGCLDSLACNYDENANFDIEELCCYVGYCNDRDISLVCPDLPEWRQSLTDNMIQINPNPARGSFKASADFEIIRKIPFSIFDTYGRERTQGIFEQQNQEIRIENLEPGIYYIRFFTEENILTKAISIL